MGWLWKQVTKRVHLLYIPLSIRIHVIQQRVDLNVNIFRFYRHERKKVARGIHQRT
ncbi:hypothetical protein HanPSC8_Chr11g0485031 [Helianthus annuus]|nr:hypothetical protein HanPSC8_Chr11g0485031 [Helianthus annuus]